MRKIRIAIAGVGNCASALVQGLAYYRNKDGTAVSGLMHPQIGAWGPTDIEVVAAFDIDMRKVGRPLEEAVFARPNCAQVFQPILPVSGVVVQMGPVLDGAAPHMAAYGDDEAFRPADEPPVDVARVLEETGAEILVCYLPVGSEEAVRHYAEACLKARVGLVNCVPVFIASDPEWAARFRDADVPVVGDDIKSQVGATIVHRTMSRLFNDRGVSLDRTYQLNTGGNTDFLNMLERSRLASKKQSKTQSVQSQLDAPLEPGNIHIGPSDYVPWQKDNKVAFIRMEGRGFGDVPLEMELRLSVQDSPNSAGVVIDAIRCARLALDRGIGGPLEAPSAYFMKSPPVQLRDSVAHDLCNAFIDGSVGASVEPAVRPAARPPEAGKAAGGPRTALILAAGMGSRLFANASLPKPLAPVSGMTLAERVVRTLIEAVGVERFVVSLGHEEATVRSHFQSIAARTRVTVEFVHASDWTRGNGASALAAETALGDEPFLLSMCDHLYEPALVRRLATVPPQDGTMLLAVDHDRDGIPDPDDLTRVALSGDAIEAIGKGIIEWDAGDTGVMYCTSGLFEGLRKAMTKGRYGLSDGLAELAGLGRALTVDVTGAWWLDVDTPEALAEAERAVGGGLRSIG